MLKKTVEFEDVEGNTRKEDFYFHMRANELTKMQVSHEGGFEGYLRRIVAEKNGEKLAEIFEKLILDAYGVKAPDGIGFIKNQELREAFKSTDAYDQIFMEIITDADKAVEFFEGVIPKNALKRLEKLGEKEAELTGGEDGITKEKSLADYTEQELVEMPQLEFDKLGIKEKWPRELLLIGMKRKTGQQ